MIDYTEHMKHLGAGMTAQEKQDAIMNGIHNNIGALVGIVQHLEQRIKALEEKINAQSRTMG
jgi:prefoldin subunit 5